MNVDERLRAAGRALRDSSVAQVDAASRLREIVRHGDKLVAPEPTVRSLPPATRPSRRSRELAIVVNLLLVVLVLAVGIVLGRATTSEQEAASTTPTPAAGTSVATRPLLQTKPQVPEACLDATELGDEVIARQNRNQRDHRLSLALRDYTIASQACRKAASP